MGYMFLNGISKWQRIELFFNLLHLHRANLKCETFLKEKREKKTRKTAYRLGTVAPKKEEKRGFCVDRDYLLFVAFFFLFFSFFSAFFLWQTEGKKMMISSNMRKFCFQKGIGKILSFFLLIFFYPFFLFPFGFSGSGQTSLHIITCPFE